MAARKRSTWDKTPWVSGPGYGGNGSATQHFHNVRTGRNRTVKSNYRSNTHTAIYWGGGQPMRVKHGRGLGPAYRKMRDVHPRLQAKVERAFYQRRKPR